MATKTLITCEEFEQIARGLGPCELIDGEIRSLAPAGFEHSSTNGEIFALLREFVRARNLGWVLAGEIGLHVQLDPPRSRGADVAYISYRRLPREQRPQGFLRVPPELVVEVYDGSSWAEMQEKIGDYHRFGVDVVWVADPEALTVHVFPNGGTEVVIPPDGMIDGGAVLPGFAVPIARFFDEE